MPSAPAKACRCGALVPAGVRCGCVPDYQRLDRNKHYGTQAWKRTAASFRAERRGICEHCGASAASEVHHRVPRSAGGTDDFGNLQLLCEICHTRHHKRKN